MKTAACVLGLSVVLACDLAAAGAAAPGEKSSAMAGEEGVPPIFSDLTVEAAVEKNTGTRNILVAKATAVWCGPCKLMDRTTWRDEKVVAWFKANSATAIQFDVDKVKETATRLNIRAMPTLIAYRNGEEIGRAVGYRTPDQLLTWVEGLRTGNVIGETVVKPDPNAKPSVPARIEKAAALVAGGHLDKATDELQKLWEGIPQDEPAFIGVRNTVLATQIGRVAEQNPGAKERFSKLAREAEAKYKAQARDQAALTDWLVLSSAVKNDAPVLAWVDGMKASEQGRPMLTRLEYAIEDVLARNQRWADLGAIIPDAAAKVSQDAAARDTARSAALKARPGDDKDARSDRAVLEAGADAEFRTRAGRLYGAMLAAERPNDAATARSAAIEADTSSELKLALVQGALDAGRPQLEMESLLNEAAQGGKKDEAEALRAEMMKRLK